VDDASGTIKDGVGVVGVCGPGKLGVAAPDGLADGATEVVTAGCVELLKDKFGGIVVNDRDGSIGTVNGAGGSRNPMLLPPGLPDSSDGAPTSCSCMGASFAITFICGSSCGGTAHNGLPASLLLESGGASPLANIAEPKLLLTALPDSGPGATTSCGGTSIAVTFTGGTISSGAGADCSIGAATGTTESTGADSTCANASLPGCCL